jgi:hypothetical protein
MDGSMEVKQGDVTQAVREAAMLATVSISTWGAERSDKTLLEKVKADAGAVGDVGRLVKNMLAGADGKLKATISAFGAVRSVHYKYTLPWVTDPHAERQRGPRLLPHLLFQDYLAAVSKQKREAEGLLADFLADYPNLVNQAKANLGGMADAVYPTEADVKSRFRVHIDFEPIPAGQSFKGLPDHVLERLSLGLQKRQERMVADATRAMWEETRGRVQHIADRLADPESKFKSSTIENVRELITLLPGWNVTGNPLVAEVVEDIKQMLTGVDAKQLREGAELRGDVAGQAKRIADKLSSWGV